MEFFERVKLVRHAFGLNQQQIAEAGNTSTQNVSKWEKDAFEPKLEVKQMIADSLFLSTDWFITGVGFPFVTNKIIILRPEGKNFENALTLLSLASDESMSSKIFSWNFSARATYFSVLFEQKDVEDSIVILNTPIGYEKLFLKLTERHRNNSYLGVITDLDNGAEQNFLTSFSFILNKYKEFGIKDSDVLIPKNYFFIELYNLDKEDLMKFVYAKAETLNEKINKAFFEKFTPDFINVFYHHHSEFKKIVRVWIKGEGFSERQIMIMKDFMRESKLTDLFEVPITFLWESYLVDGIKKNSLQPFSAAYTELLSLILAAEGQKIKIIKPVLDVTTDKLSWPE